MLAEINAISRRAGAYAKEHISRDQPLFVLIKPAIDPLVLLARKVVPAIKAMSPGNVESIDTTFNDRSVGWTIAFEYRDEVSDRFSIRLLADD